MLIIGMGGLGEGRPRKAARLHVMHVVIHARLALIALLCTTGYGGGPEHVGYGVLLFVSLL